MSIDMYLPESQSQAQSTQRMIASQQEALASLKRALSDFIASDSDLKGAAYESARMLASELMTTVELGVSLLLEKIATAVTQLPADYIAQVSGESLKESELEQDIAKLTSHISNHQSLLHELSTAKATSSNL